MNDEQKQELIGLATLLHAAHLVHDTDTTHTVHAMLEKRCHVTDGWLVPQRVAALFGTLEFDTLPHSTHWAQFAERWARFAERWIECGAAFNYREWRKWKTVKEVSAAKVQAQLACAMMALHFKQYGMAKRSVKAAVYAIYHPLHGWQTPTTHLDFIFKRDPHDAIDLWIHTTQRNTYVDWDNRGELLSLSDQYTSQPG